MPNFKRQHFKRPRVFVVKSSSHRHLTQGQMWCLFSERRANVSWECAKEEEEEKKSNPGKAGMEELDSDALSASWGLILKLLSETALLFLWSRTLKIINSNSEWMPNCKSTKISHALFLTSTATVHLLLFGLTHFILWECVVLFF